ncbi:hypothetical protein SAMN02745146_3689 [Hymenobacter daecheongensis DSM 21074]|uniref:Lipoprotein n=1 Tax=Hymenobacter daecheongensis DSM 21074 TaxID=1121955 RepID=A0A1M6LAL7_9BACT|nr:hypothetical protein [Hymenobacter daecheongensis]SHJ68246.1 hypothetical protein SAMN02745146_3689 [Hymenobacter daecheongensis DSM 21074]
MKSLSFSALLLSAALLFSGCDDKPVAPSITAPASTTAITVGEDGAPPYVLNEVQIGLALYQSSRAQLEVSGKLNNGTPISFVFKQSSPSAAGTGKTDLVEATLNSNIATKQATGSTTRDAATNTVSGTFYCQFTNGLQVNGTITNLQLR